MNLATLTRRVQDLEQSQRDDVPETIGATYYADGAIVHVDPPHPCQLGAGVDYRAGIAWERET